MAMDETEERARVRAAVDEASEEVGLATWYRSSVMPLMKLPESQFPECCGGGCEPCASTLTEVAVRARRKLAGRAT
jgi:hypothetical protein